MLTHSWRDVFELQFQSGPYGPWLHQLRILVEDRLAALSSTVPIPIGPLVQEALSGGKRLRALLVIIAASIDGDTYDKPDLLTLDIACAIEIVHKASLIHDDLIDAHDERRHKTTFHTQYSPGLAIAMGDFALTWATKLVSERLAEEGHTYRHEIVEAFHTMSHELAHGELLGLSLSQHGMANDTAESLVANFLRSNELKSASLIKGAAGIGGMLSRRPDVAEALFDFGQALGCIFQLVDDLDDLAEDARLGRLSPPLAWLRMHRIAADEVPAPAAVLEIPDMLHWALTLVDQWLAQCRLALTAMPRTSVVQVLRDIVDGLERSRNELANRLKLTAEPLSTSMTGTFPNARSHN